MLKTIRNLLAITLLVFPVASNAGVKYFGHEDLTDVGRITFGTGAAVEGTKFQVARTNDATNALFINAPENSPIQLGVNGAALFTINPVPTVGAWFNFLQGNVNGNTPVAFKLTAGDHTALAASTEASDVYFDLSRTVQFATGALTNQRAFRIDAPTYGFVGSSTLSLATTVEVGGAPVEGTNATISFSRAMNIASTSHNAGSGYGLSIEGSGIANGAGAINTIIDLQVGGGISALSLGNETSTLTNLYRAFIDNDTYNSTTLVRTVSNAGGIHLVPPAVAAGSSLVTMQNISGVEVEQGSEYPSLSALNYAAFNSLSGTIIVSGTTSVTAPVGVAGVKIGTITVDNTSAGLTMNAAASLYIEGAVAQSGNATITNKYAMWSDSGANRFDGNIVFGDETVDIGTSTVGLNDLHFGSGGIINFDGSDVTVTHSANQLLFAGASSGYTFDNPVGIGTTVPLNRLQVNSGTGNVATSSDFHDVLKLKGKSTNNVNNNVGILFSSEQAAGSAGEDYSKGGIVYTRADWGKGDMHFLQDTNTDTSDADLDDSVMVISNAGNVGIGLTPTLGKLHLDKGTGVGQVTLDGSTGGCIMLRDTDDGGWTECDAIDGVLSCTIDADGICD